MPSKRTNDSVDAILQALDRQQTDDAIEGGITEWQVDDILRSVGVHNDSSPAGQFGPVDASALPSDDLIGTGLPVAQDRFSTAALDDILADLPSIRQTYSYSSPQARTTAPASGQSLPATANQQSRVSTKKAPAAAQSASPARADAVNRQPAAPLARSTDASAHRAARVTRPREDVQRLADATAQHTAPVSTGAVAGGQTVQASPTRHSPQREPEAKSKPAGSEEYSSTDTTRTSIIKNFLRKMGGEDADQSALNMAKNQFQGFFEESAAVLPDEKGHLQDPARKKRGPFGLNSVQDSGEFVPINVSLTGTQAQPENNGSDAATQVREPKKRNFFSRLFGGKEKSEDLDVPQPRMQSPTDAGMANATSSGIQLEDEEEDSPVGQATMQLPRGNIRSKYTAGPGAGLAETLAGAASADSRRASPSGNSHGMVGTGAPADYTDTTGEISFSGGASAHRGNTGEVVLNNTGTSERKAASDFGAAEGQPGNTTVELLRDIMGEKATTHTPAPARTDKGQTVYRRAGSKAGRRSNAAAQVQVASHTSRSKEPVAAIHPAYGSGPVGEPLMTTHDDIPPITEEALSAGAQKQEGAADTPAQLKSDGVENLYKASEAGAVPISANSDTTGFTVQMGKGNESEDTTLFLSAYEMARSMHKTKKGPVKQPAAPDSVLRESTLAAPVETKTSSTTTVGSTKPQMVSAQPVRPSIQLEEEQTPEEKIPTLERIPGHGTASRDTTTLTETGVVKLPLTNTPEEENDLVAQALSSARAAAQESQFVRNIEESINRKTTGELFDSTGRNAGDTAQHDTDYFEKAAQILTDTNSEVPEQVRSRTQNTSEPAEPSEDDTLKTATLPHFKAAPQPTRHSYEKPDDAPAVRKDLKNQVLILTISAVLSGLIAVVLLYTGTAALSGGWLPTALRVAVDKKPLLVFHFVGLLLSMMICWRTILEGAAGLWHSPSPDTMPFLACVGALAQLVAMLANDAWYDPTKFSLVTGMAALVLCMNTIGKAMDAKTLLGGFSLVSAKVEHAVAYRLKDSTMLRAVTQGLSEGRPCVLVSRSTELFKGFLSNASAHRNSDKIQQQFAWGLGVCALLAFAFNFAYHRDVGLAISAFAAVLCLGAPFSGLLISALPANLMQRSAARIGAVIPGWRDIRLLGRVNIIRVTTRDIFPEGCVKLCGIKPVRKEDIDRAIIYAASLLADSCQTLQEVFLGMIGDNRKLLAKVDDCKSYYGKGYVGWINGERVLIGNRSLMEDYKIALPSLEYEQKHTLNQRRVVYLAVSGKLYSMFQLAYKRDEDTAYVLDSLRRTGVSMVVDSEDFNCDAALLEAVYGLTPGVAKILSDEERTILEPATTWLPESEGNMLHLGSFASFVGGLEAAAGAAEGERRASAVLTGSVLLSCVLGLVFSITGGIVSLPLPAMVLYQVTWTALALIFPLLQHY